MVAKNVNEALRRRAAQDLQQSGSRNVTVGRTVLGFKKTYSREDLDRIAAEREQMRARLLREG
jgi:hypothetical protein